MAKIEAGRMEVNVEPTSITDLVDGMINIMTPQARLKSISLERTLEKNMPPVETDPGKLQQILYNFLSNAIKFTPNEGRVTLEASRLLDDPGRPLLRLAVTDTGPGISPDMQDIIFEKFRQGDASHTREFTGTGLGLAICRELAEMLQAEVGVESNAGEGATFVVVKVPPSCSSIIEGASFVVLYIVCPNPVS